MAKNTARLGLRAMVVSGAAFVIGAASLLAVGGVAQRADARQASESGGAFAVDGTHSSVFFATGHMGVGKIYGLFHRPEGTYHLDANNLADSFINISIDVANVDTGNEGREKHLKSPDFFNAEQFPKVTYVAKMFKPMGEKSMRASGELTLLGVTKPVSADITLIGEGETRQGYKSGFEATFTIKRSDFGMGKYAEGDMDNVELRVAIEGARE
ncbi:MAG: YceI family protein [Phycisphaerales bacterium]|nr:YceI family protein [Phycisphaerales bacterium]